MKQIIIALFVLLAATAQETRKRTEAIAMYDYGPALVPNTPTSVVAAAQVYLVELTLTNETTSDVTCTIVDQQTPARTVYSDTVAGKGTGGNSLLVVKFNDRRVPGGIKWSCSASSAVTGYVTYRR